MRTAFIVKGAISHCWGRKAEIGNRKHQAIMARKSCLRCRRALSYCYLSRSVKHGDGREDRVRRKKNEAAKAESQEVAPPK